jgi:hypothetical protein
MLHMLIFAAGIVLVIGTLISAVRTFVLPRSAQDALTGLVFHIIRRCFNTLLRSSNYETRDRVMAFYAPLSLLLLLPTWLILITLGYMMMFWASGIPSWIEAFTISGSSLLTLGFARGETLLQTNLAFSEATLGLILVALLIAYLPTMYSAFSRRELAVTLLEARAGIPPSPIEMIKRYHRIGALDQMREAWVAWETWFAELAESHTSLTPLVFFRSPKAHHSWVTAAGTVLDAASLMLAAVDVPWDAQAALCIRSGFLALRDITDTFRIDRVATPTFPETPIHIDKREFLNACQELAKAGVPIKTDLVQAWQDFGGWRVNYDSALIALAQLTMAPEAMWSSDRFKTDHTE